MAGRPAAVLLYENKLVFDDGSILQVRILTVPRPVLGSRHDLKYQLFYGRPGERTILYDNERAKGDHRHYGDREERYVFESVEALVRDFLRDVARVRGEPISI